jgi:hypothetical protein
MKLGDNLTGTLQQGAVMNNGTTVFNQHHHHLVQGSSSSGGGVPPTPTNINLPGLGLGLVNGNALTGLFSNNHNLINANTANNAMAMPPSIAMPASASLNDVLLNDLIQLQQKQQLEAFLREFLSQQQQLAKLQQQQQQQQHHAINSSLASHLPIDLVNNLINSNKNGHVSQSIHVPLSHHSGALSSSSSSSSPTTSGLIPLQLQSIQSSVSSSMAQQSSVAIAADAIASMANQLPPVVVKSENTMTAESGKQQLARIDIDYTNVKNLAETSAKSASFDVSSRRVTFGRRINTNNNTARQHDSTAKTVNHHQDGINLDIFVENSTLVSRKHFTVELDDMDRGFFEAHCKAKLDKAGDFIEEEIDDAKAVSGPSWSRRVKYWKLYCVSKNGIFINARYIQPGKFVRLFGKTYTFRFPNTNIRVAFESHVAEAVDDASGKDNNEIAKVIMSI